MQYVFRLLVASSLLSGCGVSADDAEPVGGDQSELGEDGCPIEKPSDGSSCDSEQKVCEYLEILSNPDTLDCDEETEALRCEGGAWTLYAWECWCPEALPEAGSDCLGYHATITGCDYPASAACGDTFAFANCGSHTDYLWEVSVDETCGQ